jgi:hypothetical protein
MAPILPPADRAHRPGALRGLPAAVCTADLVAKVLKGAALHG